MCLIWGFSYRKINPEFERDMIIKHTMQIAHALELLQNHSYKQVVAMTGISRATLGRAKAELKQRDFL